MIKIFRNYFSDADLIEIEKNIKAVSRSNWKPSSSIGSGDIVGSYNTTRVAEAIVADPRTINQEIVNRLVATINDSFEFDLMADEGWSIQKYRAENKGHFYWHQDVLDFFIYDANQDKNISHDKLFIRNSRPNRKVSISVALNDRKDYNGGQFSIDMGDGKPTPVDLNRGDMIAFTSETFHGVDDVTEGHRNALIIWLIDREEYIQWAELCSDLDLESQ